jgi:hypothetical protein
MTQLLVITGLVSFVALTTKWLTKTNSYKNKYNENRFQNQLTRKD